MKINNKKIVKLEGFRKGKKIKVLETYFLEIKCLVKLLVGAEVQH